MGSGKEKSNLFIFPTPPSSSLLTVSPFESDWYWSQVLSCLVWTELRILQGWCTTEPGNQPGDSSISSKAMSFMNSLINDIFERIANESSRLAKYAKRKTLGFRDIESAVKLLLPGELATHAISEGTKVVTRFKSST
ncbi:hypothetical protein ACROYT_G003443 [Oculina patagonica]